LRFGVSVFFQGGYWTVTSSPDRHVFDDVEQCLTTALFTARADGGSERRGGRRRRAIVLLPGLGVVARARRARGAGARGDGGAR